MEVRVFVVVKHLKFYENFVDLKKKFSLQYNFKNILPQYVYKFFKISSEIMVPFLSKAYNNFFNVYNLEHMVW